jgi:putative DNA primase/helicase
MESYIIDTNVSIFNLPPELRSYPQWVVWRWGKVRKNGKREKVPIDPRTGNKAKTNDPKTWSTFGDACAYARDHFMDGIGFVFSEDDPFCGVVLDDCVDPETGDVRPGADDVLGSLNTYAEISPSGKGIKAMCRANKPGKRSGASRTPWGGGLEIYDRDRFFTVTGNVYRDARVRDA